MKIKNLQPTLLYPARLSFKIKGEIRRFPEKEEQKEFVNAKLVLQQMLKSLLYEEEKKKENKIEENSLKIKLY